MTVKKWTTKQAVYDRQATDVDRWHHPAALLHADIAVVSG